MVNLNPAAWGTAEGLRLAAAPTFAAMATLVGVFGGEGGMLCLVGDSASPIGGMVPMYVLMSVFHLPAWLKLIARAGNEARPGGRGQDTGKDAISAL